MPHRIKCKPGRNQWGVFLFFLVLVLCLPSCVSHIEQLRKAQDQFNMAASLENRLKLDASPDSALIMAGEAENSYRIAANIAAQLLKRKKGDLEKDKLLGTAYTIKAMAEWRLGLYDASINTVSEALATPNIKIYPRDMVLLQALKGLIENDQAFFHMAKADYPYVDVKNLLRESLENLNRALSGAPEGSKVRLYILLSELSVLKNWEDLRGEPRRYTSMIPNTFNKMDEIKQWCLSTKPVWENFVKEAKMHPEGGKMLILDWGRRIGMPEGCN